MPQGGVLMAERLFTDAEETVIAQEYLNSGSYQRLAERHGCAPATIRDVLKRQGVEGRRTIGEHNPRAKLTAAQVLEIRERYAAGGIDQTALAAEYGVEQTAISALLRRETWTHVGGPRKRPPPRGNGYLNAHGYRVFDRRHPLAIGRKPRVTEHRMVLWRKLRGDDAPCHWCGKWLRWNIDLETDHLNSIRDDNRPENLVPSCGRCNSMRAAGTLGKRLRKQANWRQIRVRLEALGHMQYVIDRPPPPPKPPDAYHTMTVAKVREIRQRWAEGETQTALAKAFGLSVPNVHFIVRRKTWAWLDPPDRPARRIIRRRGSGTVSDSAPHNRRGNDALRTALP
jgi:uncharacterized protein YjcR